jgi:pyrimidine operon attenuation protein/uracil phosphoribosyltransferase
MESGIQKRNCVLDEAVIRRKIRRMALQVAEQNNEEKDLVIAGINGNGEVVAKHLIRELANLAGLSTQYVSIRLNKKDPLEPRLDKQLNISGKVVIVVDDVANTGKTMMYALKPFLLHYPKKIQTLVLVERSHKLFPVQTDYVGLSIATTLQEHIFVEVSSNEMKAYLA